MRGNVERPLTRAVILQFAYVAIAMAYNGTSFVLMQGGQAPLAPTALGKATVLFLVYGLFILAGLRSLDRVYRVSMALFLLPILMIGIVPHVASGFVPGVYHSQFSWFLAIAINVLGLVATGWGVIRGAR